MPAFRSLGDLSTTFLLSRQTATLKAEVARRSTELSTGRVADVSQALRGDFRALGAVEARLGTAAAEQLAIAEAGGLAAAAQQALGEVQDEAGRMASAMLELPFAPTAAALTRAGNEARAAFEAAVAALNIRHADRSVFAGTAADAPALASAEAMLADIEAAVAGETTPAGVAAAVAAWFLDPGGGFETLGYTGAGAMAPLALGAGETAAFPVTAADPALREALAGLALGALLAGPTLAGDTEARVALGRAAAERALSAQSPLTELRARVGATEARIARAEARAGAERSALEIARSELVAADPYEAATRLETARTQLETLFALTARVSRLSLMDYLR
ncbi:MAG: flagellin [Rhodobacteraceae bacterium]|nr:flagellin [Paracoccaceae bacterium]